ncbi:MAG TPA: hypothetical protein ENJ11_08960 [Gammaproteobacteria bacterium]|nr:hypothetical protein [Gammaproteobacteria bacterium]
MKQLLKNILLLLLIATAPVQADENTDNREFLTVDRLLEAGYHQLSGEQLIALMGSKTLEVKDIETEKVAVSKHKAGEGASSDAMQRDFSEAKGAGKDKSLYFLDTRLLARAPPLQGDIRRRVVGDELISSDGTRTYHFRVYEKDGRMFAARDIDHGNVYYEVRVR